MDEMDINKPEKLENEGTDKLRPEERRMFLKAGLGITGTYLGGTILSLTTARKAGATQGTDSYPYPYRPHRQKALVAPGSDGQFWPATNRKEVQIS